MKIIFDFPPNIAEIKTAIPGMRDRRVVFTYGDTLYNPFGGQITQDLLAHEMEHQRQQLMMGPDKWWKKYLSDRQFRAVQEAMAYRKQYEAAAKWPRIQRRELLMRLKRDLSSPIYGNIITMRDASKLITGRE